MGRNISAHLRCAWLIAATLVVLPAFAESPRPLRSPIRAVPVSQGSSNYLWYAQDADCDSGDYAIVPQYADANVRAIVREQLATMRAAGMARINLGLFFAHGLHSATIIDSSDPAVVAQMAKNVAVLMADAKAAGFRQVLFRFFPQAQINPNDDNYDPDLAAEHFNLIAALRPAIAGAGIAYLIDLSIESAPRDSNLPIIPNPWQYPAKQDWSEGVRAIWRLYYAAYGSADTVGFSFLTDDTAERMRARVAHMRYVYEGHYPRVFAIDVYGNANANEYKKFTQFDAAMRAEDANGALGWRGAQIIVAETYYDDAVAAQNILNAIHRTGRRVFFLAQWPLDRGANARTGGSCDGVNMAPPFIWSVYGFYGF